MHICIKINSKHIRCCAALYILIWTITPILSSAGIYRVILGIAALLWVSSTAKQLSRHSNYLVLSFCLLVLYFVTQSLSNDISYAVSWTINMGIYVIVSLIGIYYLEREKETIPILINIMLIVISIISIYSIVAVFKDPYILRNATHMEESQGHGYAAYSFTYMCTQLIPFLLYMLICIRKDCCQINRIILIISFVLTVFLVLVSGFTIANIVTFTGIIMVIMFRKRGNARILFTILLGLIAILFYRSIINYLLNIFEGLVGGFSTYQQKIHDLRIQLIMGGGAGSSYSGRLERYKMTYNTIIRYPILGSSIIANSNYTGGHSILLDILGNNGIIVALLFYNMIIRTPIRLIKQVSSNDNNYLIIIFLVCVLLVGLFDTFSYASAWVWYIYIPFCAYTRRMETEVDLQ